VPNVPLDVRKGLGGIHLIPTSVQLFRRQAELDDKVAGEVFRLDFAPFFLPKAKQGGLVIAHDDPGIGAPYK
jgi:hypothetical protein